jgi:glutaredoxin
LSARAQAASRVVFYSRPGCHLCEQAMETLRELRGTLSFELREVNIESDPELERRFMLEIPVIEVDGVVVTQAPVDLELVREAVLVAEPDRSDGRS